MTDALRCAAPIGARSAEALFFFAGVYHFLAFLTKPTMPYSFRSRIDAEHEKHSLLYLAFSFGYMLQIGVID